MSGVLQSLVVEDEDLQSMELEEQLAEAIVGAGHVPSVRRAAGTAEALSLLAPESGFAPHIVVIDHVLAESGTGIEVLERLVAAGRPCRVLVWSSNLEHIEAGSQLPVWNQYTQLRARTQGVHRDFHIEVLLKGSPKLQGWIAAAIRYFSPAPARGRATVSYPLAAIVAESDVMKETVASIRAGLDRWTRGQGNLLVLHGPEGVGKRFTALAVARATDFKGNEQVRDRQFQNWRSHGRLAEFLDALRKSPDTMLSQNFLGGGEWSRIVPDCTAWPDEEAIVDALFRAVIQNPGIFFMHLCGAARWPTLRRRIEDTLHSVTTAIPIPLLCDRSRDALPIARQLLETARKGARLDSIAASVISTHPPATVAELRTGLEIAAAGLAAGDLLVTAGMLPAGWGQPARLEEPPPSATYGAIPFPADVVDEVKAILRKERGRAKKSRSYSFSFGREFENEHGEDVKFLLRAVALAEARAYWKHKPSAPARETSFKTFFGPGVQMILKGAKGPDRGWKKVSAFANAHSANLQRLAELGPDRADTGTKAPQ